MKHLLKKFGIQRLIAVAITAILCICMWGCSSVWDETMEDVSYSKLIGYSGDSLAVWAHSKNEETCLAKPLGDDCSVRKYGTAIIVENFYTHERVWESDYLKKFDYYDIIDDSTLIAMNYSKDVYFWSIMGDYKKIKDVKWAGIEFEVGDIDGIRKWGKDSLRIAISSETYGIFDIKSRTIVGYSDDDGYQDCSDRWEKNGVKYCINPFMEEEGEYINHNWYFDYGMILRNSQIDFIDTLWFNGDYGLSGALIPYKLNSYISLGDALIRVDYEAHSFDRSSIIKLN